MSIHSLSAVELSRIDSICMQYESDLRAARNPSIDEMVTAYSGEHSEVLRHELRMIMEELSQQVSTAPGYRETMVPADGLIRNPPDEPDQLTTDSTLGPYRIKQVLGRGGMGVVFAAYDSRLGRKVAIKTLNREFAKHTELKQRFEREARAVAAITHPQIVELFDVGVHNNTPYAVMEYLDGELLESALDQGRLPPQEVRRLGVQIADALATAHDAGVIHRDLKPQNIMLIRRGAIDQESMIKLFDFGLSRVLDAAVHPGEAPHTLAPISDSNSDSNSAPNSDFDSDATFDSNSKGNSVAEKTRFGVIMGTPGYMAPEQALGEPVTSATDIFSFGCVLYEAFYGEKAFQGATKKERLHAVVDDHPQGDPSIEEADPELAEIIRDCLRKNPTDRPSGAREIAQRLEPSAEASGSTRRTFLIAGAAGLSVGAATIGAGLLLPRSLIPLDILPNEVQSLAVLSFGDGGQRADVRSVGDALPLGVRKMSPGEELAALLVHELARSRTLKVPSFRPLVAETPEEFRRLGEELEVDALLTGTLNVLPDDPSGSFGAFSFGTEQPQQLQLDLQLVSARTGKEIWGVGHLLPSGDQPVKQSRIVTEIAKVIGDSLQESSLQWPTPNESVCRCLLDGSTRTDPDSRQGLEMARMCFAKAHQADNHIAMPLAGLALTSITLAAQSKRQVALQLVSEARRYADEALAIDKMVIKARLADAMLSWQQTQEYEKAHMAFAELAMVAENHWQVAHQFGLLQLTLGRMSDAVSSIRRATKLNPFLIATKADLIRARWFGGDLTRAFVPA